MWFSSIASRRAVLIGGGQWGWRTKGSRRQTCACESASCGNWAVGRVGLPDYDFSSFGPTPFDVDARGGRAVADRDGATGEVEVPGSSGVCFGRGEGGWGFVIVAGPKAEWAVFPKRGRTYVPHQGTAREVTHSHGHTTIGSGGEQHEHLISRGETQSERHLSAV